MSSPIFLNTTIVFRIIVGVVIGSSAYLYYFFLAPDHLFTAHERVLKTQEVLNPTVTTKPTVTLFASENEDHQKRHDVARDLAGETVTAIPEARLEHAPPREKTKQEPQSHPKETVNIGQDSALEEEVCKRMHRAEDLSKPIRENRIVRWRKDDKCGPRFPLPDGTPAQCNPFSDEGFTCCSAAGWCGFSPGHCQAHLGGNDFAAGDAFTMYRALPLLRTFCPHEAVAGANESSSLQGVRLQEGVREQLLAEGVRIMGGMTAFIAFLERGQRYATRFNDIPFSIFGVQRDSGAALIMHEVFVLDIYKLKNLNNETHHWAKDNPLIVDIGANIGVVSTLFAKLVTNSKVIAIEPSAHNFMYMMLSLYENLPSSDVCNFNHADACRIFAELAALADVGTVSVSMVYRPAATTSTDREGTFADRGFDASKGHVRFSVPLKTLADVQRRSGWMQEIAFFKIDCEGCEYSVVGGMTDREWEAINKSISGEVHPYPGTNASSQAILDRGSHRLCQLGLNDPKQKQVVWATVKPTTC